MKLNNIKVNVELGNIKKLNSKEYSIPVMINKKIVKNIHIVQNDNGTISVKNTNKTLEFDCIVRGSNDELYEKMAILEDELAKDKKINIESISVEDKKATIHISKEYNLNEIDDYFRLKYAKYEEDDSIKTLISHMGIMDDNKIIDVLSLKIEDYIVTLDLTNKKILGKGRIIN